MAFWIVSAGFGRSFDAAWVEGLTQIALWVVPSAAFLWTVETSTIPAALAALGLNGAWRKAAMFGVVATLPMAIALLWVPSRTLDFDLLFGAAKLNLRMLDLPIRYRARTYGETNISRWRHGWLLLRMARFAAVRLKFVG